MSYGQCHGKWIEYNKRHLRNNWNEQNTSFLLRKKNLLRFVKNFDFQKIYMLCLSCCCHSSFMTRCRALNFSFIRFVQLSVERTDKCARLFFCQHLLLKWHTNTVKSRPQTVFTAAVVSVSLYTNFAPNFQKKKCVMYQMSVYQIFFVHIHCSFFRTNLRKYFTLQWTAPH